MKTCICCGEEKDPGLFWSNPNVCCACEWDCYDHEEAQKEANAFMGSQSPAPAGQSTNPLDTRVFLTTATPSLQPGATSKSIALVPVGDASGETEIKGRNEYAVVSATGKLLEHEHDRELCRKEQ